MNSLPPRSICIVGALVLAAGVDSAVEMIFGLFTWDFTFDLGVVGIPIGFGVLKGRPRSRQWALLFAFAGLVFFIGTGGWLLFKQLSGDVVFSYPDSLFFGLQFILVLVCMFYVAVVLKGRAHDEWFTSSSGNSEAVRSLTWAVFAVSVVLLFSNYSLEWWVTESQKRMFPLNVTLIPFDEDTGGGVHQIAYSGNAVSRGPYTKSPFTKMGLSTTGAVDGMRLNFSGVATGPVEVRFSSVGFQEASVFLDRKTGPELRVPMTRIP